MESCVSGGMGEAMGQSRSGQRWRPGVRVGVIRGTAGLRSRESAGSGGTESQFSVWCPHLHPPEQSRLRLIAGGGRGSTIDRIFISGKCISNALFQIKLDRNNKYGEFALYRVISLPP